MKLLRHANLWLWTLPLVAGGISGCAGSAADSAVGPGAGGSSGCQTSACVPPIGTHVTWAIEIDPLSSSQAALTELPSFDVGPESLELHADSLTAVGATFTGGTANPVPTTANIVLTVPPLIGGRPDLTFECAAAFDMPTGSISGSLDLPAATITRAAAGTLQLLPLSPADQQSPPASFPVTVATSFTESLPNNTLPISGSLLSPLQGAPMATFVARAFQAGAQVSNAPLTGADGSFQLLLAPEAAGGLVTVELTPQNQGGPDPWYTSSALDPTMNRNLAPIVLPAYSNPNVFVLTVEGADDPTAAVAGALVRAQTILASSAAGKTDFLRAGTTTNMSATSPGGTVTLSLLPGTATTALDYDMTVIPPASSPYATRCVSPVGVTVGGTPAAPSSLLTIALARRSALTGTVTNSIGEPVQGVTITATAGPDPTPGCTSTPAVSSSTVTINNGSFSLPLDPGTYQLDYDPPAGSPEPRVTKLGIPIAAGAAQIDGSVVLPAGVLVQGTVLAADGSSLPSATVRIFQIRCLGQDECFGATRTPPVLLAQTVADPSGAFRAVVAASAPSD